MAGTKGRKRKKKAAPLSGTPQGQEFGWGKSLLWGTGASLLGIITAGAGASLGVFSAPLAIALTTYGIKRNDAIGKLALAAGIGIAAGTKGKATSDMEGFDPKSMAERAKSYYQSVAEKYMIPIGTEQASTSTNGLNGEDEVTYFVNPFSEKQLDMSALDRIQSQIPEMNSVSGTLAEVDISERNF
jgi:hypothetical protein